MAAMRGSVNKVILVGNLGQDPELRHTVEKKAVCNLSLATNEVWKDNEGNSKERTEWHHIVLWGKQAEFASEWLGKGRKIYVEGRLQTRSWEDKDGVKRTVTEIISDTLVMLDSNAESESSTVDENSTGAAAKVEAKVSTE